MQNLQTISEVNFKGMNNTDRAESLKPGYCVLAQNCLLGDNQIDKGPGAVYSHSSGTLTSCRGIFANSTRIYSAWNSADNTVGQIFSTNGTAMAAIGGATSLTPSLETNFCDTGSGVTVLNGTDATGQIVGIVYTTPASVPIGKYAVWINNRQYIAGNSTYPSRLYYSDVNTPYTFQVNSYIDIFPQDGSIITGLAGIGGQLIIGKTNGVYAFDGFTDDDFTVKSVTEQFPNYGVMSHRSFINTGNDLMWMSFAGDVPHIRSLKRTSFDKLNYGGVISKEIEGTMKMLNKSRLSQVAGGFDGRYAWWSVPTETSTRNNYMICYDTINEAWTVHKGHNAAVFCRSTLTGDDRLYYGGALETGKIYFFSKTSTTIDGEPLEFEYITRSFRPSLARKSKFKYAFVRMGTDHNTIVNVDYSPDGYSFENVGQVNPRTGSSTFDFTFDMRFGETDSLPRRVNLKGDPSYTYQLRFTERSGDSSDIVFPFSFTGTFGSITRVLIKEFDLLYYPKGLRDAA